MMRFAYFAAPREAAASTMKPARRFRTKEAEGERQHERDCHYCDGPVIAGRTTPAIGPIGASSSSRLSSGA